MGIKELTYNQKIREVYEGGFLKVARFIAAMRGSREDAVDIFHDALIIYHQKINKTGFVPESTPEAYILGIAKHLWWKRKKEAGKFVSAEEYELPDYEDSSTTSKTLLVKLLEKAGKKCMDLLSAFYFEENSIQSIVNKFGFSSHHSASVQKYKCIEKLRETIKSKSLSYEDFLERD